MDITKSTFPQEAARLLQDIADAHFIAFDFEFSGIAERNRNREVKQTIEERYEETRLSVQEYQPLQIGLTIVKFDRENARYVLEPYNLNISPLPLLRERQFVRKWTMSSGAVSFLHRNGFDFGRQLISGVPYLSEQEEAQARAKMTAEEKRRDLDIKLEDEALINHIRESIAEWQALSKDVQEEYLNIPNGRPRNIPEQLNGYQRRLVHQTVQNEFPGMKTTSMGHFIQITNPTSQQVASSRSLEEEARERDIAKAIGFRWIVEGMMGRDISGLPHDYLLPTLPKDTLPAKMQDRLKENLSRLNAQLKSRRNVLVGHNCLTDIMFLYKMTIGDLPLTLKEFNDKVHDLFPAIIDTKYIASCHSEKMGRLALGEVETVLREDKGGPTLHIAPAFSRYTANAFLHEAGYDSYITAVVAIRMAAKLQTEGTQRKKEVERVSAELELAAASQPPEFGAQEGYETAQESQDSQNNAKTEASEVGSSGHSYHDSISSVNSDASNMNSSTSTPEVVAVKQIKEDDDVAAVRSSFASTSIFEKLNGSAMPGDETPKAVHPSESDAERFQRLLAEGKLMPRWAEEAAFWEVYGNKLQVNGTQEGMIKIVD